MSDSGTQVASGDGEWLFPDANTVYGLQFWITTPTVEVDYLSTFPTRRVMHAGWIGVASGITGTAAGDLALVELVMINWWFFQHEQNFKIVNDTFPFYDRVQFSIPSGQEANFIVYYGPL